MNMEGYYFSERNEFGQRLISRSWVNLINEDRLKVYKSGISKPYRDFTYDKYRYQRHIHKKEDRNEILDGIDTGDIFTDDEIKFITD